MTVSTVPHARKHFERKVSKSRGIEIDRSEEYENASDSIRVNREFD
jgi:hypothetical protein